NVLMMQTATLESSDDPTLYCRTNGQGANTVWYRYTTGAGASSTSPEYLRVSTASSTYDTDIEIFAGQRQVPDMAFGGCADLPAGQEQAVARLDQPSTAYYIEIAAPSTLGGTPSLSLAVDHPPSYTVTGTADGLGLCS